jgi:hypothetical protein
MVPTLFFYHLGLVALGCVFLMLCWLWPNAAASPHQPIVPTTPSRRKRSKESKPFAGLTQRPQCALCEREATQAPSRRRRHPSRCPRRTAGRAPWRPRSAAAPMGAVAIAAGWGGAIGAPVVFQKWRWPFLHWPSKGRAVDKQTNDGVVHLYRF